MGKRTWSDEQLIEAVKSAKSYAGVVNILGLKIGCVYSTIKPKITALGLDISHFTGQGWAKGKSGPGVGCVGRSLEAILTIN
jgi:hypothetical protein